MFKQDSKLDLSRVLNSSAINLEVEAPVKTLQFTNARKRPTSAMSQGEKQPSEKSEKSEAPKSTYRSSRTLVQTDQMKKRVLFQSNDPPPRSESRIATPEMTAEDAIQFLPPQEATEVTPAVTVSE